LPDDDLDLLDPCAIGSLVVVEAGESSHGAYVPDLPGCIAMGQTRDEALQLIHEAIERHVEDLREQGLPVPQPHSSSELVEVHARVSPWPRPSTTLAPELQVPPTA
jgi:predicted RNase H-like HicB family nuclease